MSNQPPPPPPQQPYVAPRGDFDEPRKNNWMGCAIGCLVAFGLCVVVCAGAGFYAFRQAKTIASSFARQGVESVLDEANLPAEEESAILEQFDRVSEAFQSGDLTMEDLGQITENLAESDIPALITLKAIETRYLDESGLSDAEKEEARKILVRVVQGAIDEKFDQADIKRLTDHFLVSPDPSAEALPEEIGADDWKQSMTDDELRALIADARELVESKDIPEVDEEIRISDVLRGAIDEVMSQ